MEKSDILFTGDGTLTENEFVDGCMSDEAFVKVVRDMRLYLYFHLNINVSCFRCCLNSAGTLYGAMCQYEIYYLWQKQLLNFCQ